LALGAAFLGLFVHALFYSGFLEDPLTWLVLGVAAGYLTLAREPSVAEPPERDRVAPASDCPAASPRPARAGGGPIR
jgi:hypothetical protein